MVNHEENMRALRLFRNLLAITEHESQLICEGNIDLLEEQALNKKNLMCEIDRLKHEESWITGEGECAEIRAVMEKIIKINSANTEEVRKRRDRVMGEIYDQKKTKTAVRAYNQLV